MEGRLSISWYLVGMAQLVMVAVCVAALERMLQILEEDVATMPEHSLDSIKTFLEVAYRELVYTDTINPHTNVTDGPAFAYSHKWETLL